jgi:hypothetical protein
LDTPWLERAKVVSGGRRRIPLPEPAFSTNLYPIERNCIGGLFKLSTWPILVEHEIVNSQQVLSVALHAVLFQCPLSAALRMSPGIVGIP